MGGKPARISNSAPKINQINVQTSAYGVAQAIGWGTFRSSCNMIWTDDFKAIANTSSQKTGGKGGGAKVSNTTYTYTSAVMLAIVQGPIVGIRRVYKDKAVYVTGSTTALAQAGLNAAFGNIGQSAWSYLTTNHPTQALGYSGLAYAYASNYLLTDNATLSNHGFEVQGQYRLVVSGSPLNDADPRLIIEDFLTNAVYGVPGWGASLIGDLSDYSLFCRASNYLLSPCLDQQRPATEIIEEWLKATNSDSVWSDGVIKIKPLGDSAVTGNTATWTPNLSPLYDLTDDDLIPSSAGVDPVKSRIERPSDAYNYLQLEFLDRAREYNTNTISAYDQANIEEFGKKKNDQPITLHCICDATIANNILQVLLQRSCYVREEFTFNVDWRFSLLEPLDLLTITSGPLDGVFVRINTVAENDDGGFEITAEEMLVGAGSAALYSRQQAGGYINNWDADPGSVAAPLLVNPPVEYATSGVKTFDPSTGDAQITLNKYVAWIAVAGVDPDWGGCEVWVSFDNVEYERIGFIHGGARYGVTTSTLAVGTNPDTVNSVDVDLSISAGELLPATIAEAEAGSTVSIVGGEMIGYTDATLTGPNEYLLDGYLRRGLYGTPIASHASGTPFLRVDGSIFEYEYTPDQIGKTVYIKLPSFNLYQQAQQSLALAGVYSLDLDPNTSGAFEIIPGTLTGIGKLGTKDQTDTIDIIDGAVSQSIPSYTTTPIYSVSNGAALLSVTVTPVRANGIKIIFTGLFHFPSSRTALTCDLYRDGSPLSSGAAASFTTSFDGQDQVSQPLVFLDTSAVPGVTYTYTIVKNAGTSIDFLSGSAFAEELKA